MRLRSAVRVTVAGLIGLLPSMRFAISLLAVAAVCSTVAAEGLSKYWLFASSGGKTWCGFTDPLEFKLKTDRVQPTESARVTYSTNQLAKVTYQVEPESVGWIVIDKYTVVGKYTRSDQELHLRRANLLTQQNLEVIEETGIRGGKANPFHIVSITTLDGKEAQAPPTLDLPSVPIRTNLSAMPFVRIVGEMRSLSLDKLCKTSR